MTLPSPDRDVKDDVIEKMRNVYENELQWLTKPLPSDRSRAMRAAVRALAENVSIDALIAAAMVTPDKHLMHPIDFRQPFKAALRAIAGPET